MRITRHQTCIASRHENIAQEPASPMRREPAVDSLARRLVESVGKVNRGRRSTI